MFFVPFLTRNPLVISVFYGRFDNRVKKLVFLTYHFSGCIKNKVRFQILDFFDENGQSRLVMIKKAKKNFRSSVLRKNLFLKTIGGTKQKNFFPKIKINFFRAIDSPYKISHIGWF